jgi:hypothetical protein
MSDKPWLIDGQRTTFWSGYTAGRAAAIKGVPDEPPTDLMDSLELWPVWVKAYHKGYTDYKQFEKDRLEAVEEAKKSFVWPGEGDPDAQLHTRFQPGSFGHHEMTDRASIVCEMWSYVVESPATALDPDLFADAQRVFDAMWDFYQKAATKSCEADEKDYPFEGHHVPEKEKKGNDNECSS